VFLANVMRTGQDGVGSYALAEAHGGLFQQALGAHLDTIANVLNEQAIPRLMALNGVPEARWPTLAHGDVESADLARLGTYLVDLSQAGILADTPELRAFVHEIAGLPVPTVEEMAAQVAEREDRAAAMQQAVAGQGDDEADDAPERMAASEPRRLVEDDGVLSLSDLLSVVEWFDSNVPEQYRGMLNAKVAAPKDGA
jgi:phage gp29-like protein